VAFVNSFFRVIYACTICDGKIVFLTVHDVVARITSFYELFLVHIFQYPGILPKDILPNGHFAERTFCRTDILPNGQFAERTTCRK
jgi:hypothetical protein